MSLRVYALYGRSSRALWCMIIVGTATFSVACWALFAGQATTVSKQTSGCHIGLSYDTSKRLATAWEALFVYDSMIFALTLVKTWWVGRNIKIRTRQPSLITLLLRDGAIYFAVMALSNLANILTFYFCGPFLRGGLSTFSSSISVTMVSRLMLNLHETANIGIFSTQSFASGVCELSDLDTLRDVVLGHEG
ncbi:hypothetical protein BD779DRAFT_250608 [Infundibulicybe gibba]|nr:hypothetical protein BD779DRAFT_250608 [Infundibulicybe gibba]